MPSRSLFPVFSAFSLLATLGADLVHSAETAPAATGAPPLFKTVPASSGLDFQHVWNPPAAYAGVVDRAFAGGGVAVGDVSGDGLADVYLSRPFGGGRLFINRGQWTFTDATVSSGLAADAARWGAGTSMADIDNDGDLDLMVCGYDCPNRLFLNDGQGRFQDVAPQAGLDHTGASVIMSWADFDRDGDLDGYLVTNRPASAESISAQDTARIKELERNIIKDPATGQATLPRSMREEWDLVTMPNGRPFLIKGGQADRLYRNDGPAAPGGIPRFTEIAAAAGLWDNGRGLSAAWWDYDGDGWPDLYVANDFNGPDRLWRNQGDGTFVDVAPTLLRHTPWFSMGCDAGDLNNDGLPDFIASDMAGSNHYKDKMGMGDMDKNGWFLEVPTPRQYMRNAVYLNTGNGRPFLECAHQLGVAATDWTWATKLVDLDCDGWLDLYITNGMTGDFLNSDLVAARSAGKKLPAPPKRDPNRAFRNAGATPDGAWRFQLDDVGQAWGLEREAVSFGAASGDLDGDGDVDLVVNNFNEACSVYENKTPTTTHRAAIRLVGTQSNRSGFGAKVVISAGGQQQTRWLSPARGFFSSDEPVIFVGLGSATTIDTVTVHWPSGIIQSVSALAAGKTHTLREEGIAGTTADPATAAATPLFQRSPALATAKHEDPPFDDFQREPLLPNKLSQSGPCVAWGDIDGDKDQDFFLGGAAGRPGRFYFNEGAPTASQPQFVIKAIAPFDQAAAAEDMGCVFFDADGDHDLDLYVASGGVEAAEGDPVMQDRLYLNDGKGAFAPAPAGSLPPRPLSSSCVAAADIDGDGRLDLMVGSRITPGKYPLSPGSVLLHNTGQGRFTDATTTMAPDLLTMGRVTAAAWANLAGDASPDLVVTREWGSVELLVNHQGRLTSATTPSGLSQRLGWWNGLALADMDGDGRTDILATNFGLNTKYHPQPGRPARLYYADFEGTGNWQIVEAKTLPDKSLLPVRGKSCSQSAIPSLRQKFPLFHDFASSSLERIYTPEKLEKAVSLSADTLETGIWWNNPPATAGEPPRFTFTPLPALAQIAPAFGTAAADIDSDGLTDLVLAQNFYGPQRETGRMDGGLSLVLKGAGNRQFRALWPAESGIVVPEDAKTVSLIDINHDAQPDICIATNNGPVYLFENTRRPKAR